MVRFSCFLSSINHTKPKKVVLQSAGIMDSNPLEKSPDRAIKTSTCSDNHLSNTSAEQETSPSSHGSCRKSDDLTGNYCPDKSEEFRTMTHLKKTQSLGCVLDKKRGLYGNSITEENEMDHEFCVHYFHEKNLDAGGDSVVNSELAKALDQGCAEENTCNQHHENEMSDSVELTADPVHNRSIFSIGEYDEQHGDYVHTTGHIGDSVHSPSDTLPAFAKSLSETNLAVHADSSIEGGMVREMTGPRSRSLEDLCSDPAERDEFLNDSITFFSEEAFQKHIAASYSHDTPEPSELDGKGSPCNTDPKEERTLCNLSFGFNQMENQKTADNFLDEKLKSEIQPFVEFKPHNEDNLHDERRESEPDGLEVRRNLQQDFSIQNCDHLTSEEFTFKRIEDWISQIDLENGVVEELGESSSSVSKRVPHVSKNDPQMATVGITTKHAAHNLGMEVAYTYISSLPTTSSSAQMSNLGLVAVPFLGAFGFLRVLNLSGNGIVRITAGALPRGLHMLNLSKNNISTVEGLRDLTRLRVLDLSYNRLLRIGHGLASCSSLKELYLAGNMISEVEGLHRLLKLNVLDLRMNKISKAKGLDRLAANYGSLKVIDLEGNPALTNVGAEQLKKYVSTLLPHLVYYNKQATRAGSSKDVKDRPMRSHHFDRGTRGEQSNPRRGSHGSGLHRSTSSSNVQASSSLKHSKNRHLGLPPAGSKASNLQPYAVTKLSSSRPSKPIHRSLSEGTL